MPEQNNHLELSLWEPSAVNRPHWPVTVGVPFPEAALSDDSCLRLLDGEQELPLAVRVTSRWSDQSIRWVLLDFQVDLIGNERKKLTLQYGPGVSRSTVPPVSLHLEQDAGTVNVNTGADLKLTFRPGGRMPFDDMSYRGKLILEPEEPLCTLTENGKRFSATGETVKVAVEDQNALRAVVRCNGKFTADDGQTCLDVITRVYVYAAHRFVKIYHTITNLEGRDIDVEDLGLHLPTVLAEVSGRYLTAIGTDESIHRAEGPQISMSVKTTAIDGHRYEPATCQVKDPSRADEVLGTTEFRADGLVVHLGNGSEQKLGDEHYGQPILASGLICGDGLRVALTCRNFFTQAPKRLTVEGARTDLSLYWNLDGPLQLWVGTAKTHEMHIIVDDGDEPNHPDAVLSYKRRIMALQEPVMPTYGETNWVQRCGVFGPLLDYKPLAYPWLEFVFRRSFEAWTENAGLSLRGSTFLDFGDTWSPGRGGQWMNNEMDLGAGLLMWMLRTGYPKPAWHIESIIHHMIDVDTHHDYAGEDKHHIGAQRYHHPRHGAFCGSTLCHEWLEGPLYWYFYSGYERAREIALMRTEHVTKTIELGMHRIKQLERVQGWPLVALSTMNEYFPNRRYVRAGEAILDWLEQWLREDGDLVYHYLWPTGEGKGGASVLGRGVIGQALAHYHRLTGDQRAWDMLVKVMDLAKETTLSGEGMGTKTSLLRRNYYAPGESDFILEPLGYLWECTGDPEWMRLGILNFKLAMVQRSHSTGIPSGVPQCSAEPFRHWPPFLHYADRSGMLQDVAV